MARKELSTQICIATAPSAYRLLRTLFICTASSATDLQDADAYAILGERPRDRPILLSGHA